MGKILVIDDEEIMRQIVTDILSSKGHTVVAVESGHSALKIIPGNNFNLVITDILMEEKDGLEIIMDLRQILPSLPIIVMSGGARIDADMYLKIAKGLGVVYTLKKPFRNEDLLLAVNNCLGLS